MLSARQRTQRRRIARRLREGISMHVGVIHRISDPKAFQQAEQAALDAGLPEGFRLPVHAETPDHTTALCIWEGPSVDAVRDLVESVVSEYSQNEYFEVELESSSTPA
jgi:hypothetical protein